MSDKLDLIMRLVAGMLFAVGGFFFLMIFYPYG